MLHRHPEHHSCQDEVATRANNRLKFSIILSDGMTHLSISLLYLHLFTISLQGHDLIIVCDLARLYPFYYRCLLWRVVSLFAITPARSPIGR